MPEPLHSWLLRSDPAIRWQVMRDLFGEPDEKIEKERTRLATDGWAATLINRQRSDGNWGDGGTEPQWQTTLCSLVLLRDFGLDPKSESARNMIDRVQALVNWGAEFGNSPFFEGEVEPCINGRVLMLGGYFGKFSQSLLDRLLSEQLGDGGWNCEAERGSVRSSFHTTICVLEGLLEVEKSIGPTPALTNARKRGETYLLERGMFRRLSTGEAITDRKGGRDWARFSFPPTWHYDVLRGLDYLRAAGVRPDSRLSDSIALVRSARLMDGTWQLHEQHSDPIGLDMSERPGESSRWITLRALRVLNWYEKYGG